jgi:hypothetical protein
LLVMLDKYAIKKKATEILGWLSIMLVLLVQMVTYSVYQPQIANGGGRGDDGITYGAVADQLLSGQSIYGDAPFVYRMGAPWIAAKYAHFFQVSVDEAFRQSNLIMLAFVLSAIYLLALRFANPVFAAIAAILYSLPYWSYTRMVWFYPVHSDLPWLILMLVSLCMIVWWPSGRPSARWVAGFAMICFLHPITREIGLLTPILWITSQAWFRHHLSQKVLTDDPPFDAMPPPHDVRRAKLLAVLFMCCSLGGIAVTRELAFNTAGFTLDGVPYGLTVAVFQSIQNTTLWQYLWSFLLAYGGPLIALFIVYHRYWRSRVAQTPALIGYWGAVCLLALIGGVNTIRFLTWASPVVLIFIAHLSQKMWLSPCSSKDKLIGRSLLLCSLIYYIIMIHPFSGYYTDYTALLQWGGLQFSTFSQCVIYLAPCIALLTIFVMVGRKIVPDAIGAPVADAPPFPQPLGPQKPLALIDGSSEEHRRWEPRAVEQPPSPAQKADPKQSLRQRPASKG